ncbi:MAG: MerR family transcriptional regulator [Lachnospirales bacterium]
MQYKISELAKILGITTNAIRMYEKDGYITSERNKSNYRLYDKFDIYRISIIRLLIKCGFTHSDINNFVNKNSTEKHKIYSNKLAQIDNEIQRLYFLRHWLKDNIQLIDTIKEIGDNYVIKVCPALKYIPYSKDDKILKEPKRLELINKFIYEIPEIQLVKVYKHFDFENNIFTRYDAWAMKTSDITRLNVGDIINEDNEFIKDYPSQKCLYGVIEIPTHLLEIDEELHKVHQKFYDKAYAYMKENNMKICGNIMEIMVNILTDVSSALICIPFEE